MMSVPAATDDTQAPPPKHSARVINEHVWHVIDAHVWHVIDAHTHIARFALLIAQEHHSTREHQRRDGLREGLPLVHH